MRGDRHCSKALASQKTWREKRGKFLLPSQRFQEMCTLYVLRKPACSPGFFYHVLLTTPYYVHRLTQWLAGWLNRASAGRFRSRLVSPAQGYTVWQYGLCNFQTGGTKSEIFSRKNQHTPRQLLNLEFWINGGLRSFQKSECLNQLFTSSYSPN